MSGSVNSHSQISLQPNACYCRKQGNRNCFKEVRKHRSRDDLPFPDILSALVATNIAGNPKIVRYGIPEHWPSATCQGNQGNTDVMFRFGTCPTGMRVISFLDAISTADTELEPALAIYTVLLSGVKVSQSG